ncbi:MAG: hypothetical protein ACJ790_12585, partial [Myxococcaceae bacterium]
VVITNVGVSSTGSQGDYSVDMWVADQSDLTQTIYVNKFFTDIALFSDGGVYPKYLPQPGQVVKIEGVFSRYSNFADRTAYRQGISSGFNLFPAPGGSNKLKITVSDTTVTPPTATDVPSGFGNAQGGAVQADKSFQGQYVHIPGSLTITNANPTALERFRSTTDGGPDFVSGENGFEVTGGVLVDNLFTFRDAGTETGCDWLKAAQSGQTVTFPNGISGVWDTYSHSYCLDGGSGSSCRSSKGFVPGTDAGYTFVLYPTRCSVDLVGTAQ